MLSGEKNPLSGKARERFEQKLHKG